MKDHTFLFITAFMVLMVCHPSAAQTVRHVDLEYHISDFATTSSGGMLHVSAPGFAYVYDTDTLAPALPLACVYVLVGPGETLEGFNASGSTETLLDSVDLAPNPISIPTNRTAPAKVIHPVHYTNPTYPENRAVFTGVHDMGGYRVLSFLVSPLTYSPTTRTLCITPRMRLTLELQGPGRQSQTLQSGMASVVRNLVSNPSDIETLYGVAPEPRATASGSTPTISDAPLQYLIVTCDSLKSEFQRLADWKTAKGVKATVITVEDIYSTYTGRNNQLKIKQAIKHHYDTSGSQLQYVLLGGDKNIVPVQNCYNEIEIFNTTTNSLDTLHVNSPSDLFYSCLGSMEWDNNRNGLYGEIDDNINIFPYVAISRLPATNIASANSILNKIISYERNPVTDNWKNEFLMCAAIKPQVCEFNGDTVSVFHANSEILYERYVGRLGWNGSKFRFYDTGTDNENGADYDVDYTNLQAELSKGYSFVNVNTHGNEPSWTLENENPQFPYNNYFDYHATSLHNAGYSIIATEACKTNSIAYHSSLGKAFINNPNSGVVAYYGSSEDGLWYGGGWLGPSDVHNGMMFRKILNDTCIGKAVRDSKIYYLGDTNYYGPMRWLHYYLSVLCDPEMHAYSSIPVKFATISFLHYNDTFILNPGADRPYYCIMSRNDGGESYYLYYNDTHPQGNTTFTGLTGEYDIWLYGNNHIPYHGIIGPTVYLQNEIFDRDMNVTSDFTCIGYNVSSDRDEGAVILGNGSTVISSRLGVSISGGFEVKRGASLEINTSH